MLADSRGAKRRGGKKHKRVGGGGIRVTPSLIESTNARHRKCRSRNRCVCPRR